MKLTLKNGARIVPFLRKFHTCLFYCCNTFSWFWIPSAGPMTPAISSSSMRRVARLNQPTNDADHRKRTFCISITRALASSKKRGSPENSLHFQRLLWVKAIIRSRICLSLDEVYDTFHRSIRDKETLADGLGDFHRIGFKISLDQTVSAQDFSSR